LPPPASAVYCRSIPDVETIFPKREFFHVAAKRIAEKSVASKIPLVPQRPPAISENHQLVKKFKQ